MSSHDLDTLMSHADLMLYRAKHDGRNRVHAYAAAAHGGTASITLGFDSALEQHAS